MDYEEEFLEIFQKAGYAYLSHHNDTMPFRRLVARYVDNDKTKGTLEHIHIVKQGDSFVERHILFRDFLRNDDQARLEYCKMKRKLIEEVCPERTIQS